MLKRLFCRFSVSRFECTFIHSLFIRLPLRSSIAMPVPGCDALRPSRLCRRSRTPQRAILVFVLVVVVVIIVVIIIILISVGLA